MIKSIKKIIEANAFVKQETTKITEMTPEEIIANLKVLGWSFLQRHENILEQWGKYSPEGTRLVVTVPLNMEFADYKRRVREIIDTVIFSEEFPSFYRK